MPHTSMMLGDNGVETSGLQLGTSGCDELRA